MYTDGSAADREGIKKRRREEIAALPRERNDWLHKELQREPRLLDLNPSLLFELSEPELVPGKMVNGVWDPRLDTISENSMHVWMHRERWRWFCGMDPGAEAVHGFNTRRARDGKAPLLEVLC